jgi:uncharacterized protein (DUF885 family)
MNLYEIRGYYAVWALEVEDNDGELTPELEAQLDEINDTLDKKGEAVCFLVRNAAMEADACREEAARWTARARVAENRSGRLKTFLATAMKAVGVDRLAAGKFKVARRVNTVPSIRWMGSPEEIPEGYRRIKVELDGTIAQQAYKAGADMAGFSVEFADILTIK